MVEKAKNALLNYVKLSYLHNDDNIKLTLTTDTSAVMVGSVLHQVNDISLSYFFFYQNDSHSKEL